MFRIKTFFFTSHTFWINFLLSLYSNEWDISEEQFKPTTQHIVWCVFIFPKQSIVRCISEASMHTRPSSLSTCYIQMQRSWFILFITISNHSHDCLVHVRMPENFYFTKNTANKRRNTNSWTIIALHFRKVRATFCAVEFFSSTQTFFDYGS